MNDRELAQVVARIQVADNRTVDRVTLAHWAETIGHLDYTDALNAVVAHFRESTEYLMPAHIIRRVKDRHNSIAAEETDAERCRKVGPKYATNGFCAICGIHSDTHPVAA